jgi:hypothetical protein
LLEPAVDASSILLFFADVVATLSSS